MENAENIIVSLLNFHVFPNEIQCMLTENIKEEKISQLFKNPEN